jgi:hypothetical protein
METSILKHLERKEEVLGFPMPIISISKIETTNNDRFSIFFTVQNYCLISRVVTKAY